MLRISFYLFLYGSLLWSLGCTESNSEPEEQPVKKDSATISINMPSDISDMKLEFIYTSLNPNDVDKKCEKSKIKKLTSDNKITTDVKLKCLNKGKYDISLEFRLKVKVDSNTMKDMIMATVMPGVFKGITTQLVQNSSSNTNSNESNETTTQPSSQSALEGATAVTTSMTPYSNVSDTINVLFTGSSTIDKDTPITQEDNLQFAMVFKEASYGDTLINASSKENGELNIEALKIPYVEFKYVGVNTKNNNIYLFHHNSLDCSCSVDWKCTELKEGDKVPQCCAGAKFDPQTGSKDLQITHSCSL